MPKTPQRLSRLSASLTALILLLFPTMPAAADTPTPTASPTSTAIPTPLLTSTATSTPKPTPPVEEKPFSYLPAGTLDKMKAQAPLKDAADKIQAVLVQLPGGTRDPRGHGFAGIKIEEDRLHIWWKGPCLAPFQLL